MCFDLERTTKPWDSTHGVAEGRSICAKAVCSVETRLANASPLQDCANLLWFDLDAIPVQKGQTPEWMRVIAISWQLSPRCRHTRRSPPSTSLRTGFDALTANG